MAYTPGQPPSDIAGLARYVRDMESRIAVAFNNPTDAVLLRELPAVPAKYLDGRVIYADGTNYDPGGGEGMYVRQAGQWVKCSSNLYITTKNAGYTFVAADAGNAWVHTDATPRTWTIPANSSVPYPVGTTLTFFNHDGAADVTIAITTDTMRLAEVGTTGSRTLAENGCATAVKLTSTEWLISGVALT
jgi:hypothetical protein